MDWVFKTLSNLKKRDIASTEFIFGHTLVTLLLGYERRINDPHRNLKWEDHYDRYAFSPLETEIGHGKKFVT